MATLGFSIGKASAVLFCHQSPEKFEMSCARRRLRCVGRTVDLVWIRSELESKLEINSTIQEGRKR